MTPPFGVAEIRYVPLGDVLSDFTAGATPAAGALYAPVREQPQSTPPSAARCALGSTGRSADAVGRGPVPASSEHAATTVMSDSAAARRMEVRNCSS